MILILFLWVSVSFKDNNYSTMATHQTQPSQTPDILQQFDALLKNHSIVVSDRENLTKLFECIVDLCTQMPKTKLKAALKTATKAQPNTKAQPKSKAQPKTNPEELVGPVGAGDAPMISDLAAARGRGRGRPRKEIEPTILPTSVANANPNAETAEKKRRGRPKKDKSVTISSNDDEDALIEKMMADVASMKKDEVPSSALVAPAPASDEETEDEASIESLSPVMHATVPSSENLEVEVEVPAPLTKATKANAVKEPKAPKAKAVKEPKAKAVKEPKAKAVKEPKAKAVKEPKAVKESTKAVKESTKAVKESIVDAPVIHALMSSELASENEDIDGKICLLSGFPRSSFTYNGKTYLRTETDNVYDHLTYEMVGVWDHANHEIISTFDVDCVEELWLSDEE